MIKTLQSDILPHFEDVYGKVQGKNADANISMTWTQGNSSLELVLQPPQWKQLMAYCHLPEGLTTVEATRTRTDLVLAPERKDHLERHLYHQRPRWRVSFMKFRTGGILLPFGSPRSKFDTPNP